MLQAFLVVMCVLFGAPALAQSTYVAGAVGVDVLRSNSVESLGIGAPTPSGEAMAFSLRLDTAITDRWGVELAFTRPSEIEREFETGFPVPLLARVTMPRDLMTPGLGIPSLQRRIRIVRRDTTLDTVGWVAQPVSDRVDLVYLGGVAFSRVSETQEFDFTRRTLPIVIVPTSTRTITFGVGPVVGVDARLNLTDHVLLVPAVRLHGIRGNTASGWLFRSSVGLGWRF